MSARLTVERMFAHAKDKGLRVHFAVGGTWIAKTEDIREGRFKDIARNAAAAVRVARRALEARA